MSETPTPKTPDAPLGDAEKLLKRIYDRGRYMLGMDTECPFCAYVHQEHTKVCLWPALAEAAKEIE